MDPIKSVVTLLTFIKKIHERIELVKSFKESRENISERLQLFCGLLKKLKKLAENGQIKFNDTDGEQTSIGLAYTRVEKCCEEVYKFIGDLNSKSRLMELITAGTISSKFASLDAKMTTVRSDMDSAMTLLLLPNIQSNGPPVDKDIERNKMKERLAVGLKEALADASGKTKQGLQKDLEDFLNNLEAEASGAEPPGPARLMVAGWDMGGAISRFWTGLKGEPVAINEASPRQAAPVRMGIKGAGFAPAEPTMNEASPRQADIAKVRQLIGGLDESVKSGVAGAAAAGAPTMNYETSLRQADIAKVRQLIGGLDESVKSAYAKAHSESLFFA